MSASAATPTAATPARTDRSSALLVYRDDGPLAVLLGRTVGRLLPLPPVVLILVGALPMALAIVLRGADVSTAFAAAATAWLVLLAGASSSRPHADRLRWVVPPVLRAVEYGALIWFTALAGAAGEGAAFALLGAIAFRHYDLVYRLRHMARTPPEWINLLSGGWDGRLVVFCVLLALGALPAACYVVAAVLGVVLVVECVQAWTHFSRAQRPVMYEDEEDEGQ